VSSLTLLKVLRQRLKIFAAAVAEFRDRQDDVDRLILDRFREFTTRVSALEMAVKMPLVDRIAVDPTYRDTILGMIDATLGEHIASLSAEDATAFRSALHALFPAEIVNQKPRK